MSNKKTVVVEVLPETSRLRMFGSQLSCKVRSALALVLCGCLLLPLTGCSGNSILDSGKTATASDLLYSSKGIDLELLSNGDPVSAVLDIASENGTTTVHCVLGYGNFVITTLLHIPKGKSIPLLHLVVKSNFVFPNLNS